MQTEVELFEALKKSTTDCERLVTQVTEAPETQAALHALKGDAGRVGFESDGDTFERALLRYVASETGQRIRGLPVHESVKRSLMEEFAFYTGPSRGESLHIGSYLFVTGCKIVSLRRFPAGPMDWEMSGLPRSWLLQIDKRQLARLCWFLAFRFGGFQPAFFMHVARGPKNRGLLLEKEVLRAYYRMGRSLELQPLVKGIIASAWFYDPSAVSENPHLKWLSRPYLKEGGLIVTRGPAPADAGFLERNPDRKQRFESGNLEYHLGLALWPRTAAIEWARQHTEFEA